MTARLLLTALLMASARPATLSAQTPVDTASQSPMGDSVGHAEKPARLSATLKITVPGHPAVSLSLADLQALPQVTVAVTNAHTKANETYAGPMVAEVLAKAGLVLSAATQHVLLDSYVVAAGTDGYFVIFSAAELEPGLHKAHAIVALTQSGEPLTQAGAFQLIEPGDTKPARWVRNLNSLAVKPVTTAAAP